MFSFTQLFNEPAAISTPHHSITISRQMMCKYMYRPVRPPNWFCCGFRLMLWCWSSEWQGNGKVKKIYIHFKLLWCIIVKWMTFIFSFCPSFVYEFSTKATHDSTRIRNSLVRCGAQTAPSRHPWVCRVGGPEKRGVFSWEE